VAFSFLLLAWSARNKVSAPDAFGEKRLGFVAAVLGLPVAAVAFAQLLGPTAPKEGNATVCVDTPVAGSRMQARTGPFGLNSRSGPGTTYATKGRFDAGCVVGADGYCIGEPVRDVVVPLPDVRWLRLRHTKRYVSAGTLFALSAEANLGTSPEKDCPEGQPDPALAAGPRVTKEGSDTLLISADPLRTPLVGFGIMYEDSHRFEALGITPKLIDASGHVFARFSISGNRTAADGARYVTLAVVPCLAPVVPSHSGEQLLRIDLETGEAAPLGSMPVISDLERLRQAACRVDPSASNEDISKSAISDAKPN
jgi:hypothetical protein